MWGKDNKKVVSINIGKYLRDKVVELERIKID